MRTFALVVGINLYPGSANQPGLSGAVADACDFAEWALDVDGGGVAQGDLYFWTHPWPEPPATNIPNPLPANLKAFFDAGPSNWDNVFQGSSPPDRNRAPSAGEIVKTIEEVGRNQYLANEFGGVTEPSRVLVFLAGHGVRATPVGALTEETCFVAADFRSTGSDLATGVVACESLKRSLLKKRFDEALFFLDCCRVQTSKLDAKAAPLADTAGESSANWILALAAQDFEPAYETTNQPVRGAFSSALMDGLRTCREDPGSHLSSFRLRKFVRENIATYTNSGQNPRIEFRPDDEVGPLIVHGTIAAAAVPQLLYPGPLARLDTLPTGATLVIKDGQNAVQGYAPIDAGPLPVRLPDLPEGVYSLEMVGDRDRYTLFRIPGTEEIVVV